MRTQRIVRGKRSGHLVRILRAYPRVFVLAPVTVGPAIETALADRGEIIRHQILTQLVTLVHYCPQLPRTGLYGQSRGVAQACGVGLVQTGLGIDLPDQGPVYLRLHTALGDIAVGADTHVKEAAVLTDRQRLGPVVVDLGGQLGNRGRRATGLGLALLVAEANQRVLVGHIEIVLVQRQPVGRIQVVREDRLQLIGAVTICIPQQRNAIAAFHIGGALGLDVAGDHILGLELGSAAAHPLGDQDVAIGQHQGLTRDFQISGNRGHGEVLGYRGHAIAPGCGVSNFHIRQQAPLRLGQFGVGTNQLGGIGIVTAASTQQQRHAQNGQRA